MTGVARITKLDFFIMKSQGISYLSLVAVILLFGLMGSSITVLCITGAWFIALMAIIVDDITMEKAKQYANDYPANTIDYEMCEAEEVAVIQTLLL